LNFTILLLLENKTRIIFDNHNYFFVQRDTIELLLLKIKSVSKNEKSFHSELKYIRNIKERMICIYIYIYIYIYPHVFFFRSFFPFLLNVFNFVWGEAFLLEVEQFPDRLVQYSTAVSISHFVVI
jgi:hypothetical protein